MDAANSAIVSADVDDAAARLQRAGIVAAMRGGRLRTSWHVYNDERDVDRVLEALRG
jgi:selenocysteine lyase/cysteine desulfurase